MLVKKPIYRSKGWKPRKRVVYRVLAHHRLNRSGTYILVVMSEIENKDLGFRNQNQNQNQNLNLMESTEEQSGRLHQILPPRLEDAGLEDCALPPESIHQAFLKAASAVKHIFSDDDDAGDCVSNPWPTAEDTSDVVAGIQPENEPAGPCTVAKGFEAGGDEVKVGGGGVGEEVGDEVVVVGEGGVKLGEGEEACVDELQGLGIKDDAEKKNGVVQVEEGDDGKEKKKPTLVEGFM